MLGSFALQVPPKQHIKVVPEQLTVPLQMVLCPSAQVSAGTLFGLHVQQNPEELEEDEELDDELEEEEVGQVGFEIPSDSPQRPLVKSQHSRILPAQRALNKEFEQVGFPSLQQSLFPWLSQ